VSGQEYDPAGGPGLIGHPPCVRPNSGASRNVHSSGSTARIATNFHSTHLIELPLHPFDVRKHLGCGVVSRR
jgi:hypothetical protein